VSQPLSGTARTRLTRERERGRTDRADLFALLREALICHVGVVRDGAPVVLPTIHVADPDGADAGGSLYLHGSVAAGWLMAAPTTEVCVSVTLLDGIVAARSAFNHSMNYRSAVVLGTARRVTDPVEKDRALTLLVDQVVPGRSATLRANTRKELAATVVLAVPLAEASVKVRSGGVEDEPADVEAGTWAGVVPLRLTAGVVETDPETAEPVPDDVRRCAAALGPR
jgi:uncharacterized protein